MGKVTDLNQVRPNNTNDDAEEYVRVLPNDKRYLIIEFDADDINANEPHLVVNTLNNKMLDGAIKRAVYELAVRYCTGITDLSENDTAVTDWALEYTMKLVPNMHAKLLKSITQDHIDGTINPGRH